LARDLLGELQSTEFDKYAEVKSSSLDKAEAFKNYRECCEVLSAIVEIQCNEPCRVGGGCPTFTCKILECCQEKGYEGCWECRDFETCMKFESLKPFHGDGCLHNLRKVKELGVEKWAEQRQKFYVW
jgi:hypothetical protein